MGAAEEGTAHLSAPASCPAAAMDFAPDWPVSLEYLVGTALAAARSASCRRRCARAGAERRDSWCCSRSAGRRRQCRRRRRRQRRHSRRARAGWCARRSAAGGPAGEGCRRGVGARRSGWSWSAGLVAPPASSSASAVLRHDTRSAPTRARREAEPTARHVLLLHASRHPSRS